VSGESYHLILPMPAGRTGPTTGRLSVYFVPRLQAAGRLADWVRDWRNWPKVLNGAAPGPNPGTVTPGMELTIGVDNGTGFAFPAPNSARGVATWITGAPSQAAWEAVFGTGAKSIIVKRFRLEDRSSGGLLAPMYDAGAVADALRDLHRTLAEQYPDGPPTFSELSSIGSYGSVATSGVLGDYEAHMEPLGDGDVSAEPTPEDADFHQALAYVGAHPQLMRLLGLVVDLEVAIPPVAAGDFRIVVNSNYEANYPLGKTVPIVLDVASDFWPIAASGEAPGRWATIGNNTHRVESLDIEAAIAGVDGIADDAGDATTSPAPLQTAGLYVTRSPIDLVDEIEERWAEQADFEQRVINYLAFATTPAVAADGEILVAGRRYDVWDDTVKKWFSLWQREVPGGYLFPLDSALAYTPAADEGWMTYTAFTEMGQLFEDPPGNPDPPPDPAPLGELRPGRPAKIAAAPPRIDNTVVRVSPMLFAWRGWSLVADPPGRGFSGLLGPIDPKANEPTEAMPVQVTVNYDVPDQVLPRLRYTRRYKFRARIVDHAGNSRTLVEPSPGGNTETPLIRFGRTSPLGAPVPMRRVPRPIPGWGDTTTTMVIKSELLQPDATIAPTSRLVFPPQTDQRHCEFHGYPLPTDALFQDQATFDMFVARTATSIDVHATSDPVSGELLSNPPEAWRPDVDYLGEPGAQGYAFAHLPGSTGPVVSAFDTPWPNSHAIGFELRAGSSPPSVAAPSPAQATVTAYVPKGVTRTIRVSMAGRADMADHWAMLQDRGVFFAGLQQTFVEGQHWMLSVPQSITLVHAVRRPMAIPAISPGLAADRDLASTQCRFAGTFLLDCKSTVSVEVTGTWTDAVDGAPARPTTRLLFTDQIPYSEVGSTTISPSAFEIGDTKRHDAEVSLVAFSRYARYFTERATIQFTAPNQSVALYTPPLVRNDGIDPFNVVVVAGPFTAVEGRDYTVDASVGTIRRIGSNLPLNTDIDVDFIRLPITRRSDEAGGGLFPVTIPNSAVPDALLVDEVIPAFSREYYSEGSDDAGVFHQGQTVRVWVRRPWFTTGNGELLGVLVGEREDGPLNEVARDAMSSVGPQAPITVDDFPNAVEVRSVLPGHAGVGVAGHEVRFDHTRDLWFTDIAISADLGYRPFVKLALVRFQPESVDGAYVSDPVITEPIRFGATRNVYLTRNGANVEVSVVGYELRNEMTAQFQYADPDISDPDLRWTDLGSPVQLTKNLPGVASDQVEWTANPPLALPVDARPIRLVIEDVERLSQQTPGGAQLVDSIAYIEALPVPPAWTAPPATTPGAPESVTATPQHQAVNLVWSEPSLDGGSPILTYTVERRTGTGAWGEPEVVDAPTTTLLVGGLANGTLYGFRVRATNAEGAGPWSTRADATPTASSPDRVDPLQAQGGHQAALVSWDPPPDNGSAITGYRIERRQGTGPWGNGVDLSPTQTRHIARGLTNGVSYEFRVRASSALGDGPWSDPAAAVPDVMTPGRVRGVAALSGIGAATVRWRPASERGSTILGYRVQRRAAGTTDWGTPVLVGAAETSVEITGLAPGSAWEFRVRAENVVGNGAYSSPAAVTISSTVTVPGQVLEVVLVPGNTTLTATWTEPTDGGSAIIEYEVQRKTSSTLLWPAIGSVSVPGDQLVFTYTGLLNGTSYDVRVRAVNAVGDGPWSVAAVGSPTL
jgi:hypothetical protein